MFEKENMKKWKLVLKARKKAMRYTKEILNFLMHCLWSIQDRLKDIKTNLFEMKVSHNEPHKNIQ